VNPTVEVLAFQGCANRQQALDLVRRVAGELGLDPEVRIVEVPDPDAAEREGFLGSPTIRVNGRDIEPGADARTEYVHACRIYQTGAGPRGLPDEAWLRAAFLEVRR
jgi:hypothetical protein